MSITGICHYNLKAPRELLETLRAFYCDVVGLVEGTRPGFRSFGFWLYAGEKDVLHLTESSEDEERSTVVKSTFDHVAFCCENRSAFEAKLRFAGIPYEVASVPGTGQLQIFLSDPAGNGIELNFVAGA